ncbi:MAG: F0F1 ATP synthase subunit delta, partial [Prevotella sp.]|nr:F0F1 ATP synthase subunit delta [Prevotella sp.]
MNTGVISVRYARALLGSIKKPDVKERVYADMRMLAQSYINVPQLRKTVDNPMLAKEEKQRILLLACGGNPSPVTKEFIALVLKQDREDMVQFMANSFITLYRKEKNIIS